MAIRRYKVGRSYTERTHLVADLNDYEAVCTFMESLAAEDRTEGRRTQATVVDHVEPHRGDERLF